MGLGTDHIIKSEVGAFVPELWSDEVIAAYKSNLVIANLVKRMSHVGKKGDVLHIPKPVRGSATLKGEESEVTLIQAGAERDLNITINRHFEYSRLIEDLAEVQALPSLRAFYTEDAGYALARAIDTDLADLADNLSQKYFMDSGAGLAAWANNTTAVAPADVFSDQGFREAIEILDNADVPMDNRFLVVPPSVKKDILGIDRFNSSDFVDGRPVENGLIGEIYGVKIYITTNLKEIDSDGGSSNRIVGGFLAHKDAFALVEQMGVRMQTQYKQEYLADLMTADTLYGVAELRDDAAVMLAFNSSASPSLGVAAADGDVNANA